MQHPASYPLVNEQNAIAQLGARHSYEAERHHPFAHEGFEYHLEGEHEEDSIQLVRSVQNDEDENRPSPTESHLEAINFEFHNEIPQDVQEADFTDKAFRKALREVSPELSRKQQWYAFHKVEKMLQEKEATQIDGDSYDPAQPQRNFRPIPNQHSCQCGGDANRYTCAPGNCECSGCPKMNSAFAESALQPQSSQQASLEETQ